MRLESYLFTQQAFADIKRVLKPDGIFVMYNGFRAERPCSRPVAMTDKASA